LTWFYDMSEIEPDRGSGLLGVGIGVVLAVFWASFVVLPTLASKPISSWSLLLPAALLLLVVPAWYYFKAQGFY